jgi:hypothetical protein
MAAQLQLLLLLSRGRQFLQQLSCCSKCVRSKHQLEVFGLAAAEHHMLTEGRQQQPGCAAAVVAVVALLALPR